MESGMFQKIRVFCSGLSDVFLFLGVLVLFSAALIAVGIYFSKKPDWDRQDWNDRYEAIKAEEAAAEKAATLAEVQSFVDGERKFSELSPDTQKMLEAAAAGKSRYDLDKYQPKRVYDEVFDLVPGLLKKEGGEQLSPFTRDEFETRCRAYEEALKNDDRAKVSSFEGSLLVDRKELALLNRMWNSINDDRQRTVDKKIKDLPLLADGVLSARYVDSLSGGQSFLAANVEGFDPNKEHSAFSDAVASVFNAGGHTFVASDDAGGTIWLPPALKAKESEVFNWSGCVSPKEEKPSVSFGGIGLSAPIFTETDGTLVAFQIGKGHLRVTFAEKKGKTVKPDEKLYESLRRLSKLIGIEFPDDPSPMWVKNKQDFTTWDYSVGGR